MKKIKRSYTGMTLVEVLVALAVFTIISALLASACAGICTIMRKTNRLNKKISNETPDAELKNGIPITMADGTNEETSMILSIGGKKYKVIGKQYLTNDSSSYYEDGGDFKYFDIADPNTDKDGNPLPVTRPIVEEVP